MMLGSREGMIEIHESGGLESGTLDLPLQPSLMKNSFVNNQQSGTFIQMQRTGMQQSGQGLEFAVQKKFEPISTSRNKFMNTTMSGFEDSMSVLSQTKLGMRKKSLMDRSNLILGDGTNKMEALEDLLLEDKDLDAFNLSRMQG